MLASRSFFLSLRCLRSGLLLHRNAQGGYPSLMDADLEKRLMSTLFGARLVNNAFRGTLVEAMLAQVLEPDWRWCSADWASHDFENAEGAKLEVKQSAALQSWHTQGFAPHRGRFDIAKRKVRWEGAKRINEDGRYANLYIFAWHPVIDPELADHRQSNQWLFHLVRAEHLPDQQSIALSRIQAISPAVNVGAVPAQIAALLRS